MQTFDTYEYIQELQNAEVPLKQAEAHSKALKRLFDLDKLATKRDLNDLETKLDLKISDLKIELNTKIDQAVISLIKWLVPLLLGQAALIIALLKFFGFSPTGS